jgi:DNA-binding NarL/FixJ family response regulator
MTRVIVVADHGPTLESLTRTLYGLRGVDIVRHLSGRPPIGLVQRLEPDLVFIDELARPEFCLGAVRRARAASPTAAIVVRAARPDAAWLGRALAAGADAVLPAVADGPTLLLVLEEVLETRKQGKSPTAVAA